MTLSKSVPAAVFPTLVTLDKLMRGKGPVQVLSVLAKLEKETGVRDYFHGLPALLEARGWDGETCPVDGNMVSVTFHQTFRRLEKLKLVESHEDNKYEPHANRRFRLTPVTRKALKFIANV